MGGFGIQVRGDTAFFQMKKSDSVQGWRKKWFYLRCDQEGLPAFAADRELRKTKAWAHPLSKGDRKATQPLLALLRGLLKSLGRETGGVHLIATFFKLRVQPLRSRVHPMWALEHGNELDDDEVESKVRSITSLRTADTCNVKCPVKPYGPNNPVPEVSFLLLCFCLVCSVKFFFCLTRIF